MICSHVCAGCQRGNPRVCDTVQLRVLVPSWEPCPAKLHLILVYIFLRLFLLQYLVWKYFISSLQEE